LQEASSINSIFKSHGNLRINHWRKQAQNSGPALAGALPMQDLGAVPSEQWFYDVIVFTQPCYTTKHFTPTRVSSWLRACYTTMVKRR